MFFNYLAASGYARSDGIVVLYLQRACDAKRHYATIVNAATMFNGYREGTLLDLDLPSMVDFMQDFYKNAGVDPSVVPFVEAYGSGQKVRLQSTTTQQFWYIIKKHCSILIKWKWKPLPKFIVRTGKTVLY